MSVPVPGPGAAENWTLHPILEPSDVPAPGVWYVIAAEGGPSPRTGHSCVNVDGRLLFFGGANPEGCFDELFAMDLGGPAPPNPAPTRAPRRHSSSLAPAEPALPLSILLTSPHISASHPPLTAAAGRLQWADPAPGGTAPSARYEHASAAVPGSQQVCVFAGADAGGNVNDLHVYDVAAQRWSQPAVKGDPPSARTARVAAVVEGAMYVFGGGHQGWCCVDRQQLRSRLLAACCRSSQDGTVGTPPPPPFASAAQWPCMLCAGQEAVPDTSLHVLDLGK